MRYPLKYPLKRDKLDDRDYAFHELFAVSPNLKIPGFVDLRPKCPPIFDQGQLGSCHDVLTEILTIDGWKLFKDISLEDLLASVDPITKELIFEKPINLIDYEYDGDMYFGTHQSLDFAVTPNHKMIVRKWNQAKGTLDSQYSEVNAENLGWYSGLINSVNYRGIEDSEIYSLPEIEHKRIENRNSRNINMTPWLNLLGMYLADGTMIRSNEKHYKIQIACAISRKKEFVRNILDKLDIKYCELEDRITFENKQIYQEYESYGLLGVKAPDKFVPSFVFKLSSEHIKDFLFGHFNGDGCRGKNNRMFYTSSKTLSDQLQILILLSGGWSNISTRPARTSIMNDGRTIKANYNANCIIEWSSKSLSLDKKKNITILPYKGRVYCAEVPTYHTLITRRNGKILISGNCTANAGVACREMMYTRLPAPLSRLFMYYEERTAANASVDSGATMRDLCKSTMAHGVCEETYMPYDISQFAVAPSQEALDNALKYKIFAYHRIYTLQDIKNALAMTQKPVLLGMEVFQSMESNQVANTGILPMPTAHEALLGGHAVLVVGYDDVMKRLIVRNSWGQNWGAQGYFYMPYDYVTKNLAFDFWVMY